MATDKEYQALIDSLSGECERLHKENEELRALLPCKGQTMTREDAIEKLELMRQKVDEETYRALILAIKALEQEPCTDAVSREAVLKIIDGWYEQNRDIENIEDLIILITYMNSVQPKTVSSDVVSKTEVKRIVDFYKEQYDGIYHINESIEKLPSVNPQPICEEREKGECPYYAG